MSEERGYSTPCRIWQLARNKKGYGVEKVQGKTVFAHRAAYERHHGEIGEGLEVDHKCSERACVGADHLEAVPRHENLRRCGMLKLTPEQVIEIRRSTETQQVVADGYEISQAQVSRIRARKVWKDLPDTAS